MISLQICIFLEITFLLNWSLGLNLLALNRHFCNGVKQFTFYITLPHPRIKLLSVRKIQKLLLCLVLSMFNLILLPRKTFDIFLDLLKGLLNICTEGFIRNHLQFVPCIDLLKVQENVFAIENISSNEPKKLFSIPTTFIDEEVCICQKGFVLEFFAFVQSIEFPAFWKLHKS